MIGIQGMYLGCYQSEIIGSAAANNTEQGALETSSKDSSKFFSLPIGRGSVCLLPWRMCRLFQGGGLPEEQRGEKRGGEGRNRIE